MSFYEQRLSKSSKNVMYFATPLDSKVKDKETVYSSTPPEPCRQLTEIDLPIAQHAYPEADPSAARTNSKPKYTEFETDGQTIDKRMTFRQMCPTR